MKTIKAGTLPDKKTPWWAGKVLECSACRCVVELEEGDHAQTSQERHPNGAARVSIQCPTPGCDATLRGNYRWRDGAWLPE